MVKADAYGHGLVPLARTFEENNAVCGYGVATLGEALELRNLGRAKKEIIVFSDSGTWNEARAQAFLAHRLTPVLSSLHSMLAFVSCATKMPFEVEVTTGMNRSGIQIEDLLGLKLVPKGIFTHLAESDRPDSRLSRKQMKGIQKILELRDERFKEARIHWGNSGSVFAASSWDLTKSDLVRPGISLYGISPAPPEKSSLRPVMQFEAQVMQCEKVACGESVGYAGLYRVKMKNGEWIVTLGAGYADGVPRLLSGCGWVAQGKQRLPIVGRVSMDVTNAAPKKPLKVGSFVEIWGRSRPAWEVASQVGTIPYELLTGVSGRVQRIYE